VSRPDWHLDNEAEQATPPEGGFSAPVYLVHPDGYAKYATKMDWANGHPQHQLDLIEIAAVTPDAHNALWSVLLSMDLVGTIHCSRLPIDDPVPSLLVNPREVRTNGNNDGVWFNVRDVSIAFGSRCYRTEDRFVVEVDGKKWAIEGGLEGGSCRAVRTKADLVTSHPVLGALLSGGTLPSALVTQRQMTASNDDVLRRADLFFPTSLAPNCQTGY
jgi:predicted acetyltransferase